MAGLRRGGIRLRGAALAGALSTVLCTGFLGALWGGSLVPVFGGPPPGDEAGESLPQREPRPAPRRVVSVNLCTDQLAMMLAAPGQLISVSHLARDPRASVMAAEASAYRPNRGSAEDIYLMRPDLVLAGTFTTRFTVDLLRRLGVEVVELPPAARLSDVPDQLRLVGRALGREAEAEARIARFTADLARLSAPQGGAPGGAVAGGALRAATYGPGGYASGLGTLSGELLAAAGLRNVAAELGMEGGGMLPMERLVMADPDILVTSRPNRGAARAEEILNHPALQPLRLRTGQAVMTDADWVCGLPQVLDALARLTAARDVVLAAEPGAAALTVGPRKER